MMKIGVLLIVFVLISFYSYGRESIGERRNNFSFSKKTFPKKFSNDAVVPGWGNGSEPGGGNGGGNGNDNGNGGGGQIPINGGFWILTVGSAFYLYRKVKKDIKPNVL